MTKRRSLIVSLMLTLLLALGAIAFADTVCPNPDCPNPDCTGQCLRDGSGQCPNPDCPNPDCTGECLRDGSGQGSTGPQRGRGNPNRGTRGN